MNSSGSSPATMTSGSRWGVYGLFLLSGGSGLLFETLWTYQATLALGSGFWAVTAVLSAFMAGLALGNLLALRRALWTLRTYAALEAVILVTGLAALGILSVLGRAMTPVLGAAADHPALLHLLRFILSFAVLAVPSTAMGMTLPALAQSLGGEEGSFRAILGRLYGLNTLGAIGGVLAAEGLLLPHAGVYGTGVVAATLNGAAALGAWILARRGGIAVPTGDAGWDRKIPARLAPALVAVFLAGFVLLALEVVWTRLQALYFRNTAMAFAVMLVMVLSGIALGGLAGSWSWVQRPFTFLILFGAGVSVIVSYGAFPLYHPSGAPVEDVGSMLRVGFFLQFPVCFLSGVFFTMAGSALRERVASSQACAGLLALFNTFGAALGAAGAGFLLIPAFGVEGSLFVLSLVYGAAALIWSRGVEGHPRWMIVGTAAWLAAVALFPFATFAHERVPALLKPWGLSQTTKLEVAREGLNETIFYLRYEKFDRLLYHRMVVNSFSMSMNNVASDRYMSEFVYLPVALHPAPRRALLICFGVGTTARTITRTAEFERIDIVDLSRDVLELSATVFPDPATNPLKDPRVTVHVEDGRFFLQTRSDTWDVITGEPPPPDHPGVSGLYSREYFSLMRDHLSEGGIATYWLPIHTLTGPAARSVLKAWSEVFETCFLWRGARKDLLLLGFRGKPSRAGEERFTAQWRNPATLADLTGVGLDLPELLGSGFVGDAEYIRSVCAGAEPTADAFPKRMVAPGTDDNKLFESWFDSEASAARFERSASIADLWPPDLRTRTLAYFKWDVSLTSLGSYPWRSRMPAFSEFHRLCTTTPLRSLVLWAVDSDRDSVRAAKTSDPAAHDHPLTQFHLGASALAARDYARASDHFLKVVGRPGMRKIDLELCLYSLCMAGRKEEAERVLATVGQEIRNLPPDYLPWMKETFGLIPPRPSSPR